ncbi:MAG: nucleoside hydrolase [Bacteroidota bacterium]|nr:nucleoside hydrolase [Bacteroidota bacterium]
MKKVLTIIISLFLFFPHTKAHPWKPDHYVIIDTDCGLDDFRAIRLMLESSNIRILAITTSNGVINAKDGYYKVKNLLQATYHEGILVGANKNSESKIIDCETAQNFCWSNNKYNKDTKCIEYTEVLNRVFDHHNGEIIFINLGSLNTIFNYFSKYPKHKNKIKEVLWTTNYKMPSEDFNYCLDSSAYHSFLNLNLPLTAIHNEMFKQYSDPWIEHLKETGTLLSEDISRSINQPNNIFSKNLYDETAFLYLLNPNFFTQKIEENILKRELETDIESLNMVMDSIFLSNTVNTQAFSSFPEGESDYIEDIQNIMTEAIQKWGKDEWATCVLTCEIHRHVGVYTLIGAKMGVRAREYFGAGMDELKIVSYAGLEPPFSCLNDGLQVSTGATLGHGLISVQKNSKIPQADFYYLGQKITISLKDEYKTKVASKIKKLSYIHGLDSNIYWDMVRDIAINGWKDWDRHEIFDIKK